MTFPYEAGEWYVVITCRDCKSRQPIIHDLTRGQANINAIYTWTCPRCRHKDVYEGEDVELYQHPENALARNANGSA